MRGDEFNSVNVTNEQEAFTSFEYGNAQRVEYSFYKDNKSDIKDEINENRTLNHENEDEEKKRRERENVERLSRSSENGSSSNAGEESASTSSSSSSASSSSASSSSASSSASASGASASAGASSAAASTAAATVGAVVIAVPTIIAAITFMTAVTRHDFTPSAHDISYVVEMSVDPEDKRAFGIYLKDPLMEYYQVQELSEGSNNGDFFDLMSETDYTVTVLAYSVPEPEPEPDEMVPSDRKLYSPKYSKETYIVESLPEGDVLYTENVRTLKEEEPEKVIESIEITSTDYKTTYVVYDNIDITGIEITAYYTDEYYEPEVIDINYFSFNYDFSEVGNTTVTVYYISNPDITTSYDVTIVPQKIRDRLEVMGDEYQGSCYVNDELNTSNIQIMMYYTDEYYEPELIDNSEVNFVYNFSYPNDAAVVDVRYNGLYTSFKYRVYSHIAVQFELEADFTTGEAEFTVNSIQDNPNIHDFEVAVDTYVAPGYKIPLETGTQSITLPTDGSFNFNSKHGFEFRYYYGDNEQPITIKNFEGYLTDTHVKKSEVNGFTVEPVIDYEPSDTSYAGTMGVEYNIDYIDEFEIFSNFHLTLTSESEDFVYEYDLNPNGNGDGIINIMEDEKSGSQMTLDILQQSRFTPKLSYMDSDASATRTIEGEEFQFTVKRVTTGDADIRGTYSLSDDTYSIPVDITYEGFKSQYFGGFLLRASNEQASGDIVESNIITDAVSGNVVEFELSKSSLEDMDINIESMYVTVVAFYYEREYIFEFGTFEFKDGQSVNSENSFLSSYSLFDDNLVYVKLDYTDTANYYSDFRLKLGWTYQETEPVVYSYEFALDKTLNKQAVNLSTALIPGTGTTDTFDFQGRQYDYELTYMDSSDSQRKTIKGGKILFDTLEVELKDGGVYSTNTKTSYLTLTHTTSNNFQGFYYKLTSQQNPDQTYTFQLLNSEEEQYIDFSMAEQETGFEWDMEGVTFNYAVIADQLNYDTGDYEMMEYKSGTISFDICPRLEYFEIGNINSYYSNQQGRQKYFLPVCIEVVDPLPEYLGYTLFFDEDDGDTNTPVSREEKGWGDDASAAVNREAIIKDATSAFDQTPPGWRFVDVGGVFESLYGGLVSDGDNIKYTLYGYNNGDYKALQTNTIEFNVDDANSPVTPQAYGATATNGAMSSDGSFVVSIAYTNNTTSDTITDNSTIASFDFISVDVEGDQTYYIPMEENNPTSDFYTEWNISLAGAYTIEPTELGVDLGDALTAEQAEELAALIMDNHLSCVINVYYHLVGETTIQSTSNMFYVYFI